MAQTTTRAELDGARRDRRRAGERSFIAASIAATKDPRGSFVTSGAMLTFLAWLLLLVLCWPLAILALVLYPVVWLLLLPLRLLGIAVGGVLELVRAVVFLPARVLGAGRGK